jgi:integrase
MSIKLYRRRGESSQWQAQVYIGGRRYRFTCRTDNRAIAREYADQRAKALRERHDRGLVGLPEPVRMSDVFDRYEREALPKLRQSSQWRFAGIVKAARRWFVNGPLHNPMVRTVRPDDVLAWLEAKRIEGVAPRTVNHYRAVLHRLFALCVKPWLLIPSNPVAATEVLQEEPREPVLLTVEQYQSLRSAAQDHPMLSLFITLAWEAGARRGELLQLQWQDVDLARGLLTFVNDPKRGRQTKGLRSRTIPLSREALASLQAHAAQFRLSSGSPYVFHHARPNRSAKPGDRLASLYNAFKHAARAAGVPDVRFHDLRHSFVTRKLSEGVAAQLVMRYVGHADLATTLRYTHLVTEHLLPVVNAVATERTIVAK